jgi:hypothetical protein
VHAVLAAAAVVGKRRQVAVAKHQRVVVRVGDEEHHATRHPLGRRHGGEECRTRGLQRGHLRRGIDAGEDVLGLGDLPIDDLQTQRQLHGDRARLRRRCGSSAGTTAAWRRSRQVRLEHDDEADLAHDRIGDRNLERRRALGGQLPELTVADGQRLRLLGEFRVGRHRRLRRIVGDQRGQIRVGD